MINNLVAPDFGVELWELLERIWNLMRMGGKDGA
jgi:hypothetical protein